MKEAKVITVTNQKGGTGKSTTALSLLAGLTLKGYKVLGIDLDSQCNMTYTLGAEGNKTALGILTKELTAKEAIQKTKSGDFIASSKSLAGADAILSDTGKEYRLKEAIEPVKKEYDFIILDTPPALGILTVNALTACDTVIIPAQADIYSLQGIEQLSETIRPVKKYCNANLQIGGILLTRYNQRAILSRDIMELTKELSKKLGTKVFSTAIREAVTVKESQIKQLSLFDYAPKSPVTADYQAFIDELIKDEEAK